MVTVKPFTCSTCPTKAGRAVMVTVPTVAPLPARCWMLACSAALPIAFMHVGILGLDRAASSARACAAVRYADTLSWTVSVLSPPLEKSGLVTFVGARAARRAGTPTHDAPSCVDQGDRRVGAAGRSARHPARRQVGERRAGSRPGRRTGGPTRP